MIKDNIKNANKYFNISKRIELGLKYLQETDFSSLENGKYEILGKEVYAIVQEYTSKQKSEAKFEVHKKYIDIQYVLEGEEYIGVADLNSNKFSDFAPYSEEKDIVFFNETEPASFEMVKVSAKEFMILNPEDVHMPAVAIKNPAMVKKVVVKVLV